MADPWAVVATKPAQETTDEWAVKDTRPADTQPPAKPGMLDPHGKWSVGDFFRGAGSGIVSLADPKTWKGMAEPVINMLPSYASGPLGIPVPVPNVKGAQANMESGDAQVQQAKEHPSFTAGTIAGPAVVSHGIGKLLPKAAKTPGKLTRSATSTGPGVAMDLVKKTAAENEAEVVKAGEKNAKLDAERKVDLRKHFEKQQEARGETGTSLESGRPLTAEEQVSRRQAIERGVERSDTEVKADLEKTYETAKEAANKPYNELKGALQHDKADPEKIALIVADGAESVRGSETLPTALKNMKDHWDALVKGVRDDEFTYDELQGYREEIGRELRKGTLPPDVFDAYKKMNDGITKEMEDIASRADAREAQSQGGNLPKKQFTYAGKLQAARAGYRQYAETFLDRDSPIYKALNTEERGEVAKSFQGKDQSGVERLARYNPDLAKRLNTVRGLQEEAGKLPSEKPEKFKESPTLEPKKPSVLPKVNTIGADELTKANRASLEAKEKRVRTGYAPIVSTGLIIDALRNAMEGNWKNVGIDVAARGAYEVGKQGFAALLRNRSVIEFLSKPTAEQIAKIPPGMRGPSLKPILDAAQKQGIKVDPRLYAVAGGSAGASQPKKRVAAALTR